MRRILSTSLFLVYGACATADAKPPEQPKPVVRPEIEELKNVDHDVKRLSEIATLDKENEEKKRQLAALEKTVAELQAKLDEALAKTPKGVVKGENSVGTDVPGGSKVKVRLSGELVFTSGSARISRPGRKVLAELAGVLKNTPHKRIEVAGHTDSQPMGKKYEDNWQLSAERARRVVAFLHEQGVDGKHLIASGYADTEPVDAADSEEARGRNRRVEIYIEPTAETAQSADPQ
jgi:chemotaxis protein MotB